MKRLLYLALTSVLILTLASCVKKDVTTAPDPTGDTPHEHSYTATVTAPTCAENGYTTYRCACGDSYVADETEALGHQYENGVCKLCGERIPSEGLEFALNDDGKSYAVTGIGTCMDTDVVIPSTYDGKPVTGIGHRAFRLCESLTSITIPKSVTNIGNSAFYGCKSLNAVYINNLAAWCNISFYPQSNPLSYAKDLYISGELATNIVIPDGVTSIGDSAFEGYSNLTSITIPDSVTSISSRAFYNCHNLMSITISDNVMYIDYEAFIGTAYYNNEENWTDGVLYIGNHLIYAKRSLSGAYKIREGTKCIADEAFGGYQESCSKLTSIMIPDSVTSIGEQAFENCHGLTSVTIPDGVVSIGKVAFDGCSSLVSVTVPDSVTSIGSDAFSNTAYYNNETNWADGVLYIGNHLIKAKADISGAYTIKKGTKSIADFAFVECRSLTSITIPDSVTSIGGSTFFYCTGLTSVTIPSSVTSIGWGAFGYCESLASLTFKGTMAQWNAITKVENWDYNTGNYTIYCTDGEISK